MPVSLSSEGVCVRCFQQWSAIQTRSRNGLLEDTVKLGHSVVWFVQNYPDLQGTAALPPATQRVEFSISTDGASPDRRPPLCRCSHSTFPGSTEYELHGKAHRDVILGVGSKHSKKDPCGTGRKPVLATLHVWRPGTFRPARRLRRCEPAPGAKKGEVSCDQRGFVC